MADKLERNLVIKLSKCFPSKFIITSLLALLLSLPTFSEELVLVGSIAANYQPLSSFEVRKIFLGYPIKRNNMSLIAIRNTSDEEIYQLFLQKVIHLSARNYERRLMSKTFRTGTSTLLAIDTLPVLKNKLLNDKFKLSVMWLKDVELDNNLKVIQVLWTEAQ